MSKPFGYIVLALVMMLSAQPAAWAEEAKKTEAAAPAKLPTAPDDLDLINVGKVAAVKKSDLIVLNNGKTYHLDQIRVPIQYEAAAIAYLKGAILGQTVGIYADKNAKDGANDRYGNRYAHIMRDDGTWIQADMVTRGLAWAYSTDTNHTLVLPLYKYENSARVMKTGFWRNPDYAIKGKANIGNYLNSYQIYQGVIERSAENDEEYTFICDPDPAGTPALSFTIALDRAYLFQPASNSFFDRQAWESAPVRVRGWVERDRSGRPTIEVTHLEQLTFIDPATGEPTTRTN